MTTPRYEFYETDDRVIISIYDRNADAAQVEVKFEPRKLTYTHGEMSLDFQPLKGQIDTETSEHTVGKVKVEIQLKKRAHGRWGSLVGDTPDVLVNVLHTPPSTSTSSSIHPAHKNWDGITTAILQSEAEKSAEEDPNIGGDSTLNSFFQKIYSDADENTRRAMMKSFQESGGTTLSTNWDEVKKSKVDVKPPAGAEWKKWN